MDEDWKTEPSWSSDAGYCGAGALEIPLVDGCGMARLDFSNPPDDWRDKVLRVWFSLSEPPVANRRLIVRIGSQVAGCTGEAWKDQVLAVNSGLEFRSLDVAIEPPDATMPDCDDSIDADHVQYIELGITLDRSDPVKCIIDAGAGAQPRGKLLVDHLELR